MPDISSLDLLPTLTPEELYARRRELISMIRNWPGGEVDGITYEAGEENAPTPYLHEMALIARSLRQKNAGPPKARDSTRGGGKKKLSETDLLAI